MVEKHGSPSTSEPIYLVIGKLRRPHGVRGEIIMEILTDFPERIIKGSSLFVGEKGQLMRVRSRRNHTRGLIVAFEGINSLEDIGEYRNQLVKVAASGVPQLEEGEYYHHELIGLRVDEAGGMELGNIVGILETGANDVFVIQMKNGKEILIPAIDDVLISINLEKRYVVVNLLPGLVDSP